MGAWLILWAQKMVEISKRIVGRGGKANLGKSKVPKWGIFLDKCGAWRYVFAPMTLFPGLTYSQFGRVSYSAGGRGGLWR